MRVTHPTRKGFSLTEVSIVLGVVGVILGGVWSYAHESWENSNQQRASGDIVAIVKNMQSYYLSTGGGIAGTNTLALMGRGIIPGDMIVNGNVTGPWGQGVNVCGWSLGSTSNCFGGRPSTYQYFAIEFLNLSPASCIKMVMKNTGFGVPVMPEDVVINGWSAVTGGGALPPTLANVSANCVVPVAGAKLQFVFRLQPTS